MLMLLIKDARTLRKSRGGGKKHAEKKKRLKKKQKEKKIPRCGKNTKKNPRWDRGVSREKDIR